MTYQNLYAILAGKTRMTLAVAKTIAGYLGISLDQLAGMEEEVEEETQGGWMAGVADRAQWVKAQPSAPQVYASSAARAELRDAQPPREDRQALEPQLSRESQRLASPDLSGEPKHRPSRELEALLSELAHLLEEGELPEPFLHALAERLRPYLMEPASPS